MSNKNYYIISGKWSHKKDLALTLWRKNNSGYCWRKDWSGVFNEEDAKLIEKPDDILVEASTVDRLWVKMNYEGEEIKAIPNIAPVRKILGITLNDLNKKFHDKTYDVNWKSSDEELNRFFNEMVASDKALKEYLEEEDKEHEINQNVLKEVKKIVSNKHFEDICEYLKECDYTSQYEITESEPDERYHQKEGLDYIEEAWVDQYTNGGHTGDEFAGSVWLKIKPKKWFKFNYSM